MNRYSAVTILKICLSLKESRYSIWLVVLFYALFYHLTVRTLVARSIRSSFEKNCRCMIRKFTKMPLFSKTAHFFNPLSYKQRKWKNF